MFEVVLRKKTNIVLFGGSFDPPHRAHLQVIRYLAAQKKWDFVWVNPVFSHPFSKKLTSYHHRIQMLRRLLKNTSKKVKVVELEKKIKKRPCFTIDLARYLKKAYPECKFSFAMGSDCQSQIKSWHQAKSLQHYFDFIFLDRKLNGPFDWVSSTQIRNQLKKDQSKICPKFIDYQVWRYIDQHKLYGNEDGH